MGLAGLVRLVCKCFPDYLINKDARKRVFILNKEVGSLREHTYIYFLIAKYKFEC